MVCEKLQVINPTEFWASLLLAKARSYGVAPRGSDLSSAWLNIGAIQDSRAKVQDNSQRWFSRTKIDKWMVSTTVRADDL